MSGNPYKNGCKFNAIATSRDEYMAVAEALKAPQYVTLLPSIDSFSLTLSICSFRPTDDKDQKRLARWREKQNDVVKILLGPQLVNVDVEIEVRASSHSDLAPLPDLVH